jgi:small-conductance mechanosensitive channel
MLKDKEDELELLNMNLVEMKTELTIAQAELDGAYGSRAERAADVAAIKTSGEVMKLQNQLTRLKNELAGTVQELEEVTRETLSAEREKIELENKLQDVQSAKKTLEGEVMTLRQRLEADMEKAREHIAKLQEDLDGERLRAIPPNGGVGRGASMLSEQFRATMREERKKFQESLKVCFIFRVVLCMEQWLTSINRRNVLEHASWRKSLLNSSGIRGLPELP